MIDSSVDYKNLPRPTWAEIDIDAILNNINEYKKALGNKVEIIVAAKGNGYGHGMLPIVKAISELDIYGFATGNMYEAIEMRKHTVLDITNVPDAEIGDVVTLLGQNGESRIDVSEYCERLGISVIEFWCSLSFHSFPHIYVREGQPQEEVIYSYNK